jgi:hypothetical protein
MNIWKFLSLLVGPWGSCITCQGCIFWSTRLIASSWNESRGSGIHKTCDSCHVFFLASIFPLSFPFCYLIVCCLLLGSTQGKRSFSSSKKTRRWFAEAFGFALHKRYSLDHPVYIWQVLAPSYFLLKSCLLNHSLGVICIDGVLFSTGYFKF